MLFIDKVNWCFLLENLLNIIKARRSKNLNVESQLNQLTQYFLYYSTLRLYH